MQGLRDYEDKLVRVNVQVLARGCDRGGGGGGGGASGDAVVGGHAVVGPSLGPRERERVWQGGTVRWNRILVLGRTSGAKSRRRFGEMLGSSDQMKAAAW